MNILWVGTGVMGAPMAGHLMDASHAVTVSTRTRSKAESLFARGAAWTDDPVAVAGSVDIVCTMVGYPRDVEAVLLGEDGIVPALSPGAVVIDFTTSSPSLAKRIADEAAARGASALDAPVSGGDIGARNGALSIMVGGECEAYERAVPLLETVGKTIVHHGGPGSGQHAKMCNQILVATGMIGVCEALVYAMRAGLDPETVMQSVTSGAATSWALENLAPRILRGDLEPGFFVEHFVKDMGIALEECERMSLDLPGLALGHRLYRELIDLGYGRKGTQSLIKGIEARNNASGQ